MAGHKRKLWGSSFLVLSGLLLMPSPSLQAQEQALTIVADQQSANAATGVVVASGNVTIRYPAEQVEARAEQATYYSQEQRIVLEGNVDISQNQSRLQAARVTYLINEGTIEATPVAGQQVESVYVFPAPRGTTEAETTSPQ